MIAKRLQLLQELVPRLRRVAVIVRGDPGIEQKLQDIRVDAAQMKIEPLMLQATTGTALELAFARLRGERCEAVYVASGPLGPAKRAEIIALAADSRLPAMYSFRVFPVDGGLMSFGADYGDLFRRAAGFVDKILKGAKPADLPVEPPRKFDLTVNLKTAGALGLTIPPNDPRPRRRGHRMRCAVLLPLAGPFSSVPSFSGHDRLLMSGSGSGGAGWRSIR